MSRQALAANPKLTRYAAIREKVDGPAWMARHGVLSDAYQEELDRLVKDGYRLTNLCGYHPYN